MSEYEKDFDRNYLQDPVAERLAEEAQERKELDAWSYELGEIDAPVPFWFGDLDREKGSLNE